jgi:FkbM family methyltransferase
MSFWYNVGLNIEDVRLFGPRILLRHVARITGANVSRVFLPSIGSVYLRPRESDVSTFRDIFGSPKYAAYCYPAVRARLEASYSEILQRGAKPVIVDAGANIGAASLWFRKALPEASIVAIEPEENNVNILRKNLGDRPNTFVVQAAIGGAPGFVTVTNSQLSWGARTSRSNTGVRVLTVDDALAMVPNGVLLIVKIDIEGFEQELFSENTEWIDRTTMIIIEPHDWLMPGGRTSRTLQKAMGWRDFDMILDGENIVYVRPE